MLRYFLLCVFFFTSTVLACPSCPSGSSTSGTGAATNLSGCKCDNTSYTWNGTACVDPTAINCSIYYYIRNDSQVSGLGSNGSYASYSSGADKDCNDPAGCGLQVGIACTGASAVRVRYKYRYFSTDSAEQLTPWSTSDGSIQWGAWSLIYQPGHVTDDCQSPLQCGTFLQAETQSGGSCEITHQFRIEGPRYGAGGSNGQWSLLNRSDGADENCDDSGGCGMTASITCNGGGGTTSTSGGTSGGTNNYGWCFLKGTLVTLADGQRIPIESVRKGDLVWSFDHKAGKHVGRRVTETLHHPWDDQLLYTIRMSNGREVVTNDAHRFFVPSLNGYLTVAAIVKRFGSGEDLEFLGESGELIHILSLERRRQFVNLYNLEVEGTENYFAEGTLVHNGKCGLPEESTANACAATNSGSCNWNSGTCIATCTGSAAQESEWDTCMAGGGGAVTECVCTSSQDWGSFNCSGLMSGWNADYTSYPITSAGQCYGGCDNQPNFGSGSGYKEWGSCNAY